MLSGPTLYRRNQITDVELNFSYHRGGAARPIATRDSGGEQTKAQVWQFRSPQSGVLGTREGLVGAPPRKKIPPSRGLWRRRAHAVFVAG